MIDTSYFSTRQGKALLVLFRYYKMLIPGQTGDQRKALLAELCQGDDALEQECIQLLYTIQGSR